MNQRSCAAVAVDGYTLASHVAFARNGVIEDEPKNAGRGWRADG